jgi:hypothetical protein
METALQAQGAALLAGDKARFTGFVDPSAKRSVTWIAERFASLHAMGIAKWDATVESFTPYTEPRWQANVTVKYCFVAACARPLTANLHTMWDMSGRAGPKLTEIWEYTGGRASPPWAMSVLQAKAGSRVIVAATKANAGRLAGALATAEAAAKVADRYAGAQKPGKYVIYLAGTKEWGKWPYDEEGKWVAGYATAPTESVVVNVASLATTPLGELLRHEMGHVATLAGDTRKGSRADSWWLVEGMAEYIATGGSFASYSGRSETVSFVRKKWNGDLRVGEPAGNTSIRDASARYGTAYLGVSCLMKTYGREKALAFFHAVTVEGDALTAAAGASLGVPYPTVKSVCVSQVRRAAR